MNATATIALIDAWLADDSGYDERVAPLLDDVSEPPHDSDCGATTPAADD